MERPHNTNINKEIEADGEPSQILEFEEFQDEMNYKSPESITDDQEKLLDRFKKQQIGKRILSILTIGDGL